MCLNPQTGIYEKNYVLEFYDIKKDPHELNPLTIDEMNKWQYRNFVALCRQQNRISKRANFAMNGRVCRFNGRDLIDDPIF